MSLVKNCSNCKHVSYEWYQNNTCKSLKAVKDLGLSYKDFCANATSCLEIYKAQGLDTSKDCKYFELGFWAKIAQIKHKICKKNYDYKMSRIK